MFANTAKPITTTESKVTLLYLTWEWQMKIANQITNSKDTPDLNLVGKLLSVFL